MINDEFNQSGTNTDFSEEFEKIKDLEAQQYFELINDDQGCRLVYLMNDAVESFICFENYSLNGEYIPDCDEPFSLSIEQNSNYYIMIVHQGSGNVFTLSFSGLHSETWLFNYGATGHFWIKKHEKLRIIDYWLGLIREKVNILGDDFCTEKETELYALSCFMPLRYYNSVPEKYMIPNDYIYETTPEALACFRKICKESGDDFFLRLTKKYTDRKLKKTARFLSGKRGIRITDYIIDEIRNASSEYPDRSHAKAHAEILSQAEEFASRLSLNGMKARIFREEPFEKTEDSMNFSVTVYAEKESFTGIKTVIKKF